MFICADHIHVHAGTHSYVCRYTFTCVQVQFHVWADTHSCVWRYTFTCMQTHIHMCADTHSRVCRHTFMCMQTHIHMHADTHSHVCMCLWSPVFNGYLLQMLSVLLTGLSLSLLFTGSGHLIASKSQGPPLVPTCLALGLAVHAAIVGVWC